MAMDKNRKQIKRFMAVLMAMAVLFNATWADGAVIPALKEHSADSGKCNTGKPGICHIMRGGGYKENVQRTKRVKELSLSKEEQENAEEGWRWKKDSDTPLSYTLTLDNVNFEVPDSSAISLYASQGFDIKNVNIVLHGNNSLVSTKQTENTYDGSGIYFSRDKVQGPDVKISGSSLDSSILTAKGNRTGIAMATKGSLAVSGVTINAITDTVTAFYTGAGLEIKDSAITTDRLSAESIELINSSVTAGIKTARTGITSILFAERYNIEDSEITLSGPEDKHILNALDCHNSGTINIKNSHLDIKNAQYGVYAYAGTINIKNVTGTLLCSGSNYGKNTALFGNTNIEDSSIFAYDNDNMYIYGDCALPEEIKDLSFGGDLNVMAGGTFIINKDQKITFTKNYSSFKRWEGEMSKVINNGTLVFNASSRPGIGILLENNGTLESTASANGIDCQFDIFTNNGIFNGTVNEDSGAIQYVYGNFIHNYNRTLGKFGAWIYKTVFMPESVLTIPGQKTLTANSNGITWDNLNEYLVLGEGSQIIVEEGGQLLLPANDTGHKFESLNISGNGTVKIGDNILYKISYMDGTDLLSTAFANGDNIAEKPGVPVKEGYVFEGWYKEQEGGEAFNFDEPVTSDTVLYARWQIKVSDVELKEGNSVSVADGSSLIYGQQLKEIGFNTAVFVEKGTNTEIPGTLSWKTPEDIPKAGTVLAEWVFTPQDNIRYNVMEGSTIITVEKATPYISVPPEAAPVTYGSILADSVLSGGVAQQGSGSNITVNGSFTWKDASIMPAVADSGKTGYIVVFTPYDKENYNSAETAASLIVKPSDNTPGQPSGIINVPYSCKKADDVVLPEKWEWISKDKDTSLVPLEPVEVTAVYTGADKDNYKNIEVIVTIIRAACIHKNTKLVNSRTATCQAKGYTGDIICTDCNENIETGKIIPMLEHERQGIIIKQPTTTETGIREYRCKLCGSLLETEVIDKLPQGQPVTPPPATVTPQVTPPLIMPPQYIIPPQAQTNTPAPSVTPPQIQTSTPSPSATPQQMQTSTPAPSATLPPVQTGTPPQVTMPPYLQTSTPPSATVPPQLQTSTPQVSVPPQENGKNKTHQNNFKLNAGLRIYQSGKNVNITWGKVSGADGYNIYIQYCGLKFSTVPQKQEVSAGKTKIIVKKLNGKKLDLKRNYKTYITAYKLEGSKKVIIAKSIIVHIAGQNNKKYANPEAVKTNKDSYVLKQGETARIQAEIVLDDKKKKLLPERHVKQFRYESSNKKTATISSSGIIKAKKKGSCIIYIYASNGCKKAVKVKVNKN